MERHLGARADDQAIVLIPIADYHMRLNVGLLHLRHLIIRLKNLIGIRKSLVKIANINPDFSSQISSRVRIGKIYIFWFVMQDRRARLHRFGRIQQSRQGFIFHFNQA